MGMRTNVETITEVMTIFTTKQIRYTAVFILIECIDDILQTKIK